MTSANFRIERKEDNLIVLFTLANRKGEKKSMFCSTHNNGQSIVNDPKNLSFDQLKYVMTGHSDQQLLVYLQCVFFL